MKRVGITSVLAVIIAIAAAAAQPTATQLPPFGGAAEYRADLAARRARVLDAVGADAVAVFWSAPERVYSNDVNYEYRQDSNLLYLSGIDQADTILVLAPGSATREALFVRAADPRRELWNGHVLTASEATAISGVQAVFPTSRFDAFLDELLKDRAVKLTVIGGGPRGARGGAGATPVSAAEPGSPAAFADVIQKRFPNVTTANAAPILNQLRAVKTPYEQKLLRRSAEISAEAHIEGMKAARPGRWEYEVEAAIEYWYLKNGAMSWGYPSIVGSGPNATTLHYESSSRQMRAGDLLLVDAAANFQGLTADITRTYPVSGKFTPEQREIYTLVLQAQNAELAAIKPGIRVADMRQVCRSAFGPGLLRLGLITDATSSQQIDMWFPHGPTHGIGVDVHDPLGQTFAVGNAFTIEPGLYIRQDTLDNLPKTPENAAIVEKIRPAVQKYLNIGVRIEDSFLLTDTGPENLSVKAPKQIGELEKIVGKE